jgi:hypothetical protein
MSEQTVDGMLEYCRKVDAQADRLRMAVSVGEGFHGPAVTKGVGDTWLPYCPACSHIAGEWVNRCEVREGEWPERPLAAPPVSSLPGFGGQR